MRSCRSFVALLTLVTTAPVLAQQDPNRTVVLQKLLAQYDKNQNGKVEKVEYPRGDTSFANLDADRNGVVDAADFAPRMAPRARGDGRARAAEDPKQLPKVGDLAPDFELPMLGMKGQTVKLSSFAGDRPVALIFGSYT